MPNGGSILKPKARRNDKGLHATTIRVHDAPAFAEVVRELCSRLAQLDASLSTQKAICGRVRVPEAALTRLLSGAQVTLSKKMLAHLWAIWGLLPRAELRVWGDRLRRCLESRAASALQGAQLVFIHEAVEGARLARGREDFWFWTPDELLAMEHGGTAVWADPPPHDSPWRNFEDYDLSRLLQRLRDSTYRPGSARRARRATSPSMREMVSRFSRDMAERGFEVESPVDDERKSPALLYLKEFPDTSLWRCDPRALLAWRRILSPLLASRQAPLELSWQEMSDEQLWRYLKHALAAELVLLERASDAERARVIGDHPKDYLAEAARRSGRPLWDVESAAG